MMRLGSMLAMFVFVAFLLALSAAGYDDRFFSIKENPGEYDVLPGDAVDFVFNLSNRDILSPRNVTAYIKDCPVGWKCERGTFAYDDDGIYHESLKVKVPGTAIPRKYTMYIMLESEWDVRRGDDKVVVTVLSEEQANTLTYEEYLAKEAERKAAEEERKKKVDTYVPPETEPEDTPEPELYGGEQDVEESVAPEPEEEPEAEQGFIKEEAAEIVENVERLETSHQFVEYASVVLGAILVFIAIGAFVTYKRDK